MFKVVFQDGKSITVEAADEEEVMEKLPDRLEAEGFDLEYMNLIDEIYE